MNREQRRNRLKQGAAEPGQPGEGLTIREYLSEPNLTVRRAEAWQLIGMRIRAERAQRRYNRFYNRWLRAVRRFVRKHFWLEEVVEEEFPDVEDPTEETPDIAP